MQLVGVDAQASLLLNFAAHAFLNGFTQIEEASYEVERALSRLFGACSHKELVAVVTDNGYCGGSRISVIGKAAGIAPTCVVAVLYECVGPA